LTLDFRQSNDILLILSRQDHNERDEITNDWDATADDGEIFQSRLGRQPHKYYRVQQQSSELRLVVIDDASAGITQPALAG